MVIIYTIKQYFFKVIFLINQFLKYFKNRITLIKIIIFIYYIFLLFIIYKNTLSLKALRYSNVVKNV